MIFNTVEFIHKISINIKELNSVSNIEDILEIKLKTLENKCFEYGYIKEKSIKILKKSQGFLNPIIFVPFIEYKVLCSANVFKPNIDDIYLVDVLSINKIAIMCCIKYTNNNKTIIPIRIIIAKHTQNNDIIMNIKKNDKIYIKILGYKFIKNATRIDAIANIVTNNDIDNIKKLKTVINELNSIEHDCKIEINNINKYTNILKFILEKDTILYNELFIYNFIKEKNITYDTSNILNIYNTYLNNFYKTNDNINDTILLCNETDLTNETNPDDETYPEDDVETYDDNDDFYEYDYIEEDNTNTTFNEKKIKSENDHDNEEDDEDDEEDEECEDDECEDDECEDTEEIEDIEDNNNKEKKKKYF